MAQFATVAAITGNGSVFAVNAQGISRAVKAGDELQKGETVRTVGDARVELLMEDGSLLAVAPQQNVHLDANVVESDQRPTAQDSAVVAPGATADTVIQALERGTDLSTELEATAAGLTGGAAGASDGGNTFVQLLRITEGVDPLVYEFAFQAPSTTTTTIDPSAIQSAPLVAAITINTIAGDNVINLAESNNPVTVVTGTVGADVKLGDTVTLTVNGHNYTTTVVQGDTGLVFSVPVTTHDLVVDPSIDVSVITSNATGTVTATATAGIVLTVDITPPVALITIDPIAGDNVINAAEAVQLNTSVSGTVGGETKAGDTVTLSVNGHTFTGTVTGAPGSLVYSIAVTTADLVADKNVHASVTATDAAGNSATGSATHAITVDTASATMTLNVSDANINNLEGANTVTLSGHVAVTADSAVTAGSTVTITDGHGHAIATATVGANGDYTTTALGSAIAGQTLTASTSGSDVNGSSYSASQTHAVGVDTLAAHITINPITGDDNISFHEALQSSTTITGVVTALGTSTINVGEDVTLTINGHTYQGVVQNDLTYSVANVQMSDLVVNGVVQQVVASVTMTDANGSQTSASTTDTPMIERLVFGTPGDDNPIAVQGSNDILIGDTGGSTLQAGSKANIVLVLDTSGSMGTSTISFTNSSGTTVNETRLQAMINSVDATLNQLHNSGAIALVHIDQFSTTATSVGTFDVSTTTGLANAIAAVNGLTATNTTNYEAGLQSALSWISSTGADMPLAGATVNKLVFISDGQPNALENNTTSGAETTTAVSATAAQAIAATLGSLSSSGTIHADHISEVAAIAAAGYDLHAVGIQVGATLGSASSPTALGFLSELEGYNYTTVTTGHAADNITTANDLSTTIGSLTGAQVIQMAAGNDVINGGSGNDIIFGDAVNTDALAAAHGLTTPAGAGNLVFQQLHMTEAQIGDYIVQNLASPNPTVQLESGRTGGNDTINGGAGNDIIFGQEGNDTITGGAGNDVMSGGTGANTFVWLLGDQGTTASPAADVITDFKLAPVGSGGDVLNLKDLLVGEHDGSVSGVPSNLAQYLHFADVGGHTVLEINHLGTSATTPDQAITFSNYASVSALATAMGAATTDADIIAKMIATGHLKTDV